MATTEPQVDITVEVQSSSPVQSVDVLRGTKTIATEYGYSPDDLGSRYRVTFHGAEYRGRGRQTNWKGKARFANARIECFEKVNVWNHERLLEQVGLSEIAFDILTTGNFQGFDVWLTLKDGAVLEINSNLVNAEVDLGSLGVESEIYDAGGLERAVRVVRLPDQCNSQMFRFSQRVEISPTGDTPIWVRVTTEDGHVAWSSPIYIFAESGSKWTCPEKVEGLLIA